ncbi:MAG: type II secretion system F family protein [Thiobacillaceae bacterium]|jgi:type IV pilus assembly protein PilC|nr:type II secretion system F family protein [Thiobacillaceae bacterium]
MPYYRYKAGDLAGHQASGEMYAANEVDVELRLRQMGLVLIRLRAQTGLRWLPWRRRVTRRELIGFCFHIQQLARAGVPLLDGLRDLIAVTGKSHFRDVLSLVADDLEGGKLLSEALAAHPRAFDEVFVALVQAAEASDQLSYVFAQLEERLKAQEELEAEFARLLIYPAVVALAVLAAAGVLLFYLTPRLALLVHSLNMPVPAVTRWLMTLSLGLRDHLPWLVVVLAALGLAGALAWRRMASLRDTLDSLWLRLPAIGEAARKRALARFTSLLALLTQSGLNILEALSACEHSVGNRHLARRIAQAGQLIAAGETVSASFRDIDLFPPLVLRMIHTGERSGALAEALNNAAWFFARDARETVARALKLLEPALALLLGGLLAFLLLAVFLPVYQIIGEIRL